MTAETTTRKRFLEEYRCIRHAERRGSDSADYYRMLPWCEPTDPNAAMWAMRAKTYSYFLHRVLRPLEARHPRPLNVLDLGAGNCWLSNRLSLRRHLPVAVDIFADDLDGLGAARHYTKPFPVIEADFNHLPVPHESFDLTIFNASFHYSTNYVHTLREVRNCLRASGLFVILDTPTYMRREDGARMVEEKHAAFLNRYGFRSDALPSLEFLDPSTLQSLQTTLNIRWQTLKPWYGLRWHLRSVNARLEGRRRPSKFWIYVGKFQNP